jgi:Na+-translocating ferredoxin:NAD+ oxidoreductase subunit B
MRFLLRKPAEKLKMSDENSKRDRRSFLGDALRAAGALGIGGAVASLAARKGRSDKLVWQLDPAKCISCGNCATYCVLDESAVKCVHNFTMCGYCDLCTGYFHPDPIALKLGDKLNSGAEDQLCPTGAIVRKFVEDPYFEYTIDERLCIGCGKCVKGCNAFGNGSLQLQVRHDRCKNCNECSIAAACPSQAYSRVPLDEPYLLKEKRLHSANGRAAASDLPSPFGRGAGGEGLAGVTGQGPGTPNLPITESPKRYSPHPSPLPKGEGTTAYRPENA